MDRETGQPVPGGLVGIEREGARTRKAVTGRDGAFCLDEVSPGGMRLTVSLMGYSSHVEEIALAPGAALDLEIALRSDPIQLAPVEILGESPLVNRKRTGTVSKLPPRTVELIRPVGTQELLELLPGINGYADDGFGNSRLSIGIRGLNPRRSSRVLILEDGVPIQPALYVYPNAYYNPPSERIDAMEVVKGSSAVRFGPQTMGGVINYTTRRPDGTRGMVNQLAAGGNGYYSLYSEWRGLGGGRTASDAQLLYKHGNGFRDNNTFDQLNGTVKTQVRLSNRKVLYLKLNGNLESSNATYTGLTEYSFRTDPAFNPKEHDVFDVRRASLDLMYTSRITPDLAANTTLYLNAFDRRWWREDDIFVRASALETGDLTPVPYYQGGDLVRVGGGAGNFGILRTFYVGGVAQDYTLQHTVAGHAARAEAGARAHWERFVDDRKIGGAPDAREGVYYTGTPGDPGDPVKIVGQSHHYETAALALYARERVEWGRWTLSPGARFEIFEQERVDRLRGAILADKLSWVLLPGLGVNYQRGAVNLFAGVHRGYTPPSSGALLITNFGQDAGSGGLDLKPEKSWNLEAGVRSRGPALTLEACAFLLRIEDLVAAGRGTAFRNLGQVETSRPRDGPGPVHLPPGPGPARPPPRPYLAADPDRQRPRQVGHPGRRRGGGHHRQRAALRAAPHPDREPGEGDAGPAAADRRALRRRGLHRLREHRAHLQPRRHRPDPRLLDSQRQRRLRLLLAVERLRHRQEPARRGLHRIEAALQRRPAPGPPQLGHPRGPAAAGDRRHPARTVIEHNPSHKGDRK